MSKKEFPCAAVICNFRCGSCGFNPQEQKRRLREGRFMENRKGVRRLLFPPVSKGEDAQ